MTVKAIMNAVCNALEISEQRTSWEPLTLGVGRAPLETMIWLGLGKTRGEREEEGK